MVNLQHVPKEIRYNIRRIKKYKYDTNVEDINQEFFYDEVTI